jgi:hypothetical protein
MKSSPPESSYEGACSDILTGTKARGAKLPRPLAEHVPTKSRRQRLFRSPSRCSRRHSLQGATSRDIAHHPLYSFSGSGLVGGVRIWFRLLPQRVATHRHFLDRMIPLSLLHSGTPSFQATSILKKRATRKKLRHARHLLLFRHQAAVSSHLPVLNQYRMLVFVSTVTMNRAQLVSELLQTHNCILPSRLVTIILRFNLSLLLQLGQSIRSVHILYPAMMITRR